MPIGTFNILSTKGQSKVVKTRDGTDVAARYFVYKLYEATDGHSGWRAFFVRVVSRRRLRTLQGGCC